MSISFAATPQSKEAQQARTYTDPSAGAPPSRRSGYNAPYVDLGHWNKVFTDQNYFDSIAKQKGMTEGAKVSLHGDDYVYRQAMIGYLADTRKVPLDDMRSIFDAEKDGFAKTVLGKQTASAREMFDWQKGQFERSNEKQAAARMIEENVMRRSLEDAFSGGDTPFVESVAKDIEAAGDLFDEEEKSRLWEKAEQLDKQIRASQAQFAPEARYIFNALRQYSGESAGFGAPEMADLAGRLAKLPTNQRRAIMQLAGSFGQLQQIDKGFWYQMAESIGRGTTDFSERIPRNTKEQTLRGNLRLLKSEQPVFKGVGLDGAVAYSAAGETPITPEEREQAIQDAEQQVGVLMVQRELRELAETQIDPIKTVTMLPSWVEEGLYGAARSVPYTAAAAVPVAGVFGVAAALYSKFYDQMMVEHPDADPNDVALVAAIGAPVAAGLERLKLNTIMGRLPIFGRLVERLVHPNQKNVYRIMWRGGGMIAEQNVQEFAQERVYPLGQSIASALDADIPSYDWEKWYQNLDRELLVQFVALLPLSLLGAGVIRHQEIKRGDAYLKDKPTLMKVLSEAATDRVLGAATTEEAQAIFREEYAKRTPEEAKAAAQRVVDEVVAVRQQQQSPDMPKLERRGAEYVVVSPDGQTLAASTDQTTAEQALLSASREAVEKELMVERQRFADTKQEAQTLKEWWLAEDPKRQANERRVIREGENQITAQQKLEMLEKAGNKQGIEELRRRIAQSPYAGTAYDKIFILGEASVEQVGEMVFQSVIALNPNSDVRAAREEMHHTAVRVAVANGRADESMLRGWLEQSERVFAEKGVDIALPRADMTDIVESMAVMQEAFENERISADVEMSLPQAFVDYIKRMIEVFVEVLKRGKALREAFDAGALPSEFEAFLAETTGVADQTIVDRSREKTAQEVAPEMANYSISLVGQYVKAKRAIEDSPLADEDASVKRGAIGYVDDYDSVENLLYVDFGKGAIAVDPAEVSVASRENYSIAITPQQDADYLAAVERDDMETAQRMVDEAARAAGYGIGPVWHGTQSGEFEMFLDEKSGGRGFYFAKKKEYAGMYAKGDSSRIIAAYLNLQNPISSKQFLNYGKQGGLSKAEAVEQAKKDGFDGIDSEGAFVAFYATQIKSADPVTRDSQGNVIPLSQRFDATTGNINYSIGSAAQLAAQNAEMAKEIQRKADAVVAADQEAEDVFFTQFWPKMLKKAGLNLKPTKANLTKAAEYTMPELLEWLKDNPQYLDYYHKDWDLTKTLLQAVYPNMTDDQFIAFRLFTGITSPNTKLRSNMADAVQLFDLWMREGSIKSMEWEWSAKGNRKVKTGPFMFSGTTGAGKTYASHVLEDIFQEVGSWQAVLDHLYEAVTVKEINAYRNQRGWATGIEVGKVKEVVKAATGQSDLIPRMFIFGPKVGAYTLNTSGDDRFTTTDIWEGRFIRSHFPSMFETADGLPVSVEENRIFQEFSQAFNEVFQKMTGLNLPPSALQAVRWFFMLNHAKKAGYRYASTDDTISGYAAQAIRGKLGFDLGVAGQGGRGSGQAGDGAGSQAGAVSNYSIAAAQEQRKADVAITPDTPVAKSINGVSAEDIFASAKERFGITNSIYEAGYVLPDGTMLDFSGRSQASGYKRDGSAFRPTDGKSDYLRDSRGIDHREIEWDGMPEYTETWGSMADFLRLGAVRIDGNSGTISMRSRLRPTSAQLRVLKDLVTSADGAYLDLEDDLGNGTAMMLESGKWTRVHGFLERWANGETPSVTRSYSISTQSEIDRVQAAMDRLARSPSERISQYAALKERLAAALERNKPIMQSMRGDMLPQDFDRTRILNDLGFLDYILKVLPPEVRGRVGGYTNLASIAPVDVYKGDQKVSEAKNPAGAIISAWMREGQNIGQAQKNTALPEGYSTVPNTTDERRDKTIANFLIDRLKKIDRELERYYKRDLMERIFDVLDKSRPKSGQSGVKRSTLGPETQKFADMVYRSSLLDDEKTAEKLTALEAQITGVQPKDNSPEAIAESQKRISDLSEEWTIVNTFGDLKSRPSETLAYGLEWLQTQLKAGREAWQIKEAARIQENRERAAKVIAFLGKPTDFGRFENKSALQRFLQAVNAFDLDHKSFDQFAPYLFGDEVAAELSKKMQRAQIDEAKLELENTRSILAALRQGAKAAGMSTSKALVAFKENQPYAVRKMEGRKVKDTKISIELAKKIVRGLADRGSLSNQDVQTLSDELAALPRDTKKEFVTIKQVIFRGEEVRLTMSRAQAMQLWLTWQQSDAQEKMRADGFTDDSFDDLDNLISGPFAQAILRVTSRIYGSGYALTNPIYARMFGMNMPMVRNYAPARYLSSKEVKDVGLDGSPLTAGGQPSFAKSRVNHTAKLAPEDALTVLQSHIAMQSHWVAFAEVTREYRSLLSNPDVRESIRQRLGADVLRTAEMWGDQMEQRGGNKGREIAWINNMLGAVIGGQSVSLLGYNLKSLMMQTDNFMRFFLALDSRQIGSALSDPVALMQNVRKVWKTDIIQTRLEGGATAETRFFFERFVSMFRRGAKVAEMSMMPMNYLDSAGLSVSGAIVYQAAYKDALDSGVDPTSAEQVAKDAVEAMVYRYGQPVLMGQKSNIENSGNAFTKAFFLFMSDPRLKMAIISDSVRGLATGRGDWKTHVRRIVAIEMMAVVSHVLATAFRDATSDDEDEDLWSMGGFARALLLAPFQGYFLLGSVSDLVLSRLTEAQWFTPTQNPLIRTADTAFRAFNNLDDAFNFDDPDALVKEWTNITRSIAVTPPLAAPAVIMNLVRPLVQGWEHMLPDIMDKMDGGWKDRRVEQEDE